jgi:hypothetical protein
MSTFDEILRLVVEAGRIGGIPDKYLHIASASAQDGSPHVELNGDTFAYVVSERGCELSRQETKDLDELLFFIVGDMAAKYAYEYECQHRTLGQDSRRTVFELRLIIMKSINDKWGDRLAHKLSTVLESAPYVDI